MDTEENNRSSHFTGKVILTDTLTITVEYDVAALVKYLANRTIVRVITPERIKDLRTIERNWQEDKITLTESWIDKQSGAQSLQQIASELVVARVSPEEQEEYHKEAERIAARSMEPLARSDLMAQLAYVASLSMADAIDGSFKKREISAARFDTITEIPLLGVKRRGRGGPNRKSKDFNKEEDFKQFARKTNELRPLWDFMTNYFERNDFDAGCAKSVTLQERFKELSNFCLEVPPDLLRRVFDRKASGGEKLWPIAFALEHAYRELRIRERSGKALSHWTLKRHYEKGKKLLEVQQQT